MTWPTVALGEVCEFRYGKSLPASTRDAGEFPVFGSNGVVGQHSEALVDGPAIIVGRKGSFGEVAYSEGPCWPIDTTYFIDPTVTRVDPRWLYHLLGSLGLTRLNRAAAIPGLNREDAYRLKVLLPPLDEQRRIAAILDQADAIRAKRRSMIRQMGALEDALFRASFDMLAFPLVSASQLMPRMRNGVSPSTKGSHSAKSLTLSSITRGAFDARHFKVALFDFEPPVDLRVQGSDFLMCRGNGNRNLVGVGVNPPEDRPDLVYPDTIIAGAVDPDRVDRHYLTACWRQPFVRSQVLASARTTSGIFKVNQQTLGAVKVPLPPMSQQVGFAERCRSLAIERRLVERAVSRDDELFASLQARAFKGEL